MIDPRTSDADAARAAILPLDCPLAVIENMFTAEAQETGGYWERLDQYGERAIRQLEIDPEKPEHIRAPAELATFSALTALRIERADPLVDSRYYKQEPEQSAERRMMRQPFWKTPGLSLFGKSIQRYYIATVLYSFQNKLSTQLQCELAAALLISGQNIGRRQGDQTYRNHPVPLYDQCEEYTSPVLKFEDSFAIPHDYASERCRAQPLSELQLPNLTSSLPPFQIAQDKLIIPEELVLTKLANYAWHAWHRLVNYLFNVASKTYVDTLREKTPRIRNRLRQKFERSNLVFSFDLGVSNTENPLRRYNALTPVQTQDKRLITVIDTIRWSSNLQYDEPFEIKELYNELCQFFPAPERPSNAVSDITKLQRALENANDDLTSTNQNGMFEISPVRITPFYPGTEGHLWDQYRTAQAQHRQLPFDPSEQKSPYLPADYWFSKSPKYNSEREIAERKAVSKTRTFRSLAGVRPLINPQEIDGLSLDEIIFLTRVGLAMARRIESYSLIDSMSDFHQTSEDRQLDVDIDHLSKTKWLTNHDKWNRTYYTIPWSMRKRLGIKNVAHDGWGERMPHETTIHRLGVDLLAFYFAAKPDVSRVVRYFDMWRLCETPYWDKISHLENKRVDVVAFSDGFPAYAGEVETKYENKSDIRSSVDKMQSLNRNMSSVFIVPNGRHLPRVMSSLAGTEYFNLPRYKNSSKHEYRPYNIKRTLKSHNIFGNYFDDLLSYHNLRKSLGNSFNHREVKDKVVGSI